MATAKSKFFEYHVGNTVGFEAWESERSINRQLHGAPLGDSIPTISTAPSVIGSATNKLGGSSAPNPTAPEREIVFPKVSTKKNMLLRDGVTTSIPTQSTPVPIGSRKLKAMTSKSAFATAKRACQDTVNGIAQEVLAQRRASGNDRKKFFDSHFYPGDRDVITPEGTDPSTSTVRQPSDTVRIQSLWRGSIPLMKNAATKAAVKRGNVSPSKLTTFSNSRVQLPDTSTISEHTESSSDDSFDNLSEESDVTEGDERCFDELRQGCVGDLHLISAITAIVASGSWGRQHLHSLMVVPQIEGITDLYFDFGVVGVLLYLNGHWEWIVVDDVFPVIRKDYPLFLSIQGKPVASYSTVSPSSKFREFSSRRSGATETAARPNTTPTELWPMVLEKAVAKAYGSYDAIDGSTPREALTLLLGGWEDLLFLFNGSCSFSPPVTLPTSRSPVLNQTGECVPGVVPALLGGEDSQRPKKHLPRLDQKRRNKETSRSVAFTEKSEHEDEDVPFLRFQEALFEREGLRIFGIANCTSTKTLCAARVALETQTKAEEEALRDYAVEGTGAELELLAANQLSVNGLYPVVRCWRDEEDGLPRVQIYDLLSSDTAVHDYNVQRENLIRVTTVRRFMNDAVSGRRSEESVWDYANRPVKIARGSAARFITMKFDTFVKLFRRIEMCCLVQEDPPLTRVQKLRIQKAFGSSAPLVAAAADDGGDEIIRWHSVEFSAPSPPTVATDDGGSSSCLRQFPIRPHVLHFETPVKAALKFILEQDDPQLLDSWHENRKRTPQGFLQLHVLFFGSTDPSPIVEGALHSASAMGVSNAIFHATSGPYCLAHHSTGVLYRRQVALNFLASYGYYLICPEVLKAPSVSFVTRVVAPAGAVMSLRPLPLPTFEQSTDWWMNNEQGAGPTLTDAPSLDVKILSLFDKAVEAEGTLSPSRHRSPEGHLDKDSSDGKGGVTTRFLPRTGALILEAVYPQKLVDGVLKAVSEEESPARSSVAKEASSMVEATDEEPPNSSVLHSDARTSDGLQKAVTSSFDEADISRQGVLQTDRQVERALQHFLLHHSALGARMKELTAERRDQNGEISVEDLAACVKAALAAI